jgi:hypothetical protein
MPDTDNDTQPSPNLSTEPGRKDSDPLGGTETQPRPNLSTEHQREGDARAPSDTLDRGQAGRSDSIEPDEVPGDAEDIEVGGVPNTAGPSG